MSTFSSSQSFKTVPRQTHTHTHGFFFLVKISFSFCPGQSNVALSWLNDHLLCDKIFSFFLSFKVVVREVTRLRPISDYLFPAAESLLSESEPAPEKEAFETRLVATRTIWEGVRVRSDKRHVVIEQVFPLAQNYDDAFRALNVWLKETEQKVINLVPVPCNMASLRNQQKTLTVSVPMHDKL